jgi:hypothetical protein
MPQFALTICRPSLLTLALLGLVLPGRVLANCADCHCQQSATCCITSVPAHDAAYSATCHNSTLDDGCLTGCSCPSCDEDTAPPAARDLATEQQSDNSATTSSFAGLATMVADPRCLSRGASHLRQQNGSVIDGPLQPLLCVWLA